MTEKIKNRYRQKLGKWGEDIALQFLEDNGCKFVTRNFRTPDGEIDIIMLHGDTLLIVEVKTRKNEEFSFPEESITDEKVEHLLTAAEWFFQESPQYSEDWRIDVITVVGSPTGTEPSINWFENVS